MKRQMRSVCFLIVVFLPLIATYNNCGRSDQLSGSLSSDSDINPPIMTPTNGKIRFFVQPSPTVIAGQSLSVSPEVMFFDLNDNPVTVTNSVSLEAFTDNQCQNAAPSGSLLYQFSTVPGSVKFSQVNYNVARKIFIKATSVGFGSACSTEVNVSPGPAQKLLFQGPPSATSRLAVSLPMQPVVEIQDAFGNQVNDSNTQVLLAAFSDANCTQVINNSLRVANNPSLSSAGVSKFNGVSFNLAGTVYLKASATGLTPACSSAINVSGGFLSNIAAASGLSITTAGDLNGGAQGTLAFSDFNNDGFVDLALMGANNQNARIYKNNGGNSFAALQNFSGSIRATVFGDCNNDGYRDFLQTSNGSTGLDLFRFDVAQMLFVDISAGSGLSNANPEGAVWLDFNKDGLLDIFQPNGNSGTGGMLLSRNTGNCVFADSTASAGLPAGQDLNPDNVLASDFDSDGDTDLFVGVSQFSGGNLVPGPLKLFRNNGNSTFSDISVASGLDTAVNWNTKNGMASGDYDNDGDFDLFISKIGAANRLYRNNGNGTFTDISAAAGMGTAIANGYGASFGDLDNDGDLDIYMVNNNSIDQLYRNNGDGTFASIESIVGLGNNANDKLFTGVAMADTDNDGDLDIFVNNLGASPTVFYRNDHNGKNFLRVRVKGKGAAGAPADGTGAIVRLYDSTGSILRAVREVSGGGMYGQNEPIVHFGLANTWGADTGTYVVRVKFTSGVEKLVTTVVPKNSNLLVGNTQLPQTIEVSE